MSGWRVGDRSLLRTSPKEHLMRNSVFTHRHTHTHTHTPFRAALALAAATVMVMLITDNVSAQVRRFKVTPIKKIDFVPNQPLEREGTAGINNFGEIVYAYIPQNETRYQPFI